MRRSLIIFLFAAFCMIATSCSRKTGCPSFNKKTGQYYIKPNKKTTSGLFPKKMK